MTAFDHPEAYERWMGRWSRRLAPPFLDFAGPGPAGRFLDVGSGTGQLARTLLARSETLEVVGIEPAASYVAYARDRLRDPRARFEIGDAQALCFPDDSFDGAFALLVLQEIPDPAAAVREMRRVTRPGGLIAATQWDFRDGMPMLSEFWAAVAQVVPPQRARAEAASRVPSGLSDPESQAALWRACGLIDVESTGLDIIQEFAGFDDYWAPFTSNATPTSSFSASLSEAERSALAEALRRRLLGEGPDRAFSLKARAWAVRGLVP